MVLGKLLVPGRPSRARAYCACSRCGWRWFGHFFSLSPFLWETARYRLKYCLKGPFNPKQPTNQPIEKVCKNENSTINAYITYLQLLHGNWVFLKRTTMY